MQVAYGDRAVLVTPGEKATIPAEGWSEGRCGVRGLDEDEQRVISEGMHAPGIRHWWSDQEFRRGVNRLCQERDTSDSVPALRFAQIVIHSLISGGAEGESDESSCCIERKERAFVGPQVLGPGPEIRVGRERNDG